MMRNDDEQAARSEQLDADDSQSRRRDRFIGRVGALREARRISTFGKMLAQQITRRAAVASVRRLAATPATLVKSSIRACAKLPWRRIRRDDPLREGPETRNLRPQNQAKKR
jgi:hypothetical protein